MLVWLSKNILVPVCKGGFFYTQTAPVLGAVLVVALTLFNRQQYLILEIEGNRHLIALLDLAGDDV